MTIQPRTRDLIRRWWAFFNSDRGFQFSLYAVIFLFLNVVSLGFGIARISAERDLLYNQRDVLPQRDISQWQRQTLKLINLLSHDDAPRRLREIRLNFSLAESRIALIESEQLDFLPVETRTQIHDSRGMWSAITAQLDDWYESPRDSAARAILVRGLTQMEHLMNNALTEITVFGLDLNTQAREANSRLLLVISVVAACIVLAVILIASIVSRLSRRNLQTSVEKESILKFPDQSPFPIMRFDPGYNLLYGNPASKPLEQLFAIQDGKATAQPFKTWLDQSFATKGSPHVEAEAEGRTYSIMSAPVAGENALNIYGFDVSDLKDSEIKVRRQLARLDALHKVDTAISTAPDLRTTLKIILDQTREQLNVDAAAIFITHPNDERLYSAAFQGFVMKEISNFSLMPGESLAGRVAADRKLLSVPDLIKSGIPVAPELNHIEGFKSYFASPLEARGRLLGVLETFQRTLYTPDEEWLEFLRTLGGQAAIALDNANLFDGLKFSNLELLRAYDTTLEGWARALELRDKETEGHARRVTELTMLLAVEMGVPADQRDNVRRGAILHDIGKMGVPDEILLKPGKLDENEWVIMKKHTEYAYNMLSPIEFLEGALDIPYAHHEKWDGSGYPRGLKAEQIPLPARMFAIVDVWDALRSDRPYRPAWERERTLAYINENANTHFDPNVVDAFMHLVTRGHIL